MFGTLVNVCAVIIGSCIGVGIHSTLPKRIIDITFQGIGLFTLVLGISMAIKTTHYLIMIVSIVSGSIIGELVDIEKAVNTFSEKMKDKIKSKDNTFSEGVITASLLYCTGSMAILGAIEEGLGGEPHLLLAKSVLDGVTSIFLASSLGVGVLFSALPLLIYQGGITIGAGLLQPVLTENIITELTAVGGVLLVGLGITLLEIKQVKIMNMLPSLVIAVFLAYVL